MDIAEVRADLLAEQQVLDEIVGATPAADWARPTPSRRWTVADQIAHLAHVDRAAATSITDPSAFERFRREFRAAVALGGDAVDAAVLGPRRGAPPAELLAGWREDRAALAAAAATLAEDARLEWYGPPMGARSFLTARLMEAWAHGLDVVDALGASRPATDRLRHIVALGVITRVWSYRNRGLEPPADGVLVEVVAPSGATWEWGEQGLAARIRGTAEDFCAVVTQRRHLDDTALVTEGPTAREWMLLAQAFAGPPTSRPPR